MMQVLRTDLLPTLHRDDIRLPISDAVIFESEESRSESFDGRFGCIEGDCMFRHLPEKRSLARQCVCLPMWTTDMLLGSNRSWMTGG